MPNLLSLAAKFAPLSEAEMRLLDAATKNDVAICGPNDNDKDPRNNPANIRKAEAERQIRANLIRWLCVNRQASALVDPSGVQVYGAHILGMLDLCLPKMSSGANPVEISDIQEDEMQASLVRRSECNNVTLR